MDADQPSSLVPTRPSVTESAPTPAPPSKARIIVATFHGKGHIFPCGELCHRLLSTPSTFDLQLTILGDAGVATSLHAIQSRHPSSIIVKTPQQQEQQPPENDEDEFQDPMQQTLLEALQQDNSDQDGPLLCVIADVMLHWVPSFCKERAVPCVLFCTSGAANMALEHALWNHFSKLPPEHRNEDVPVTIPGIPSPMSALSASDVAVFRHDTGPPPPGDHRRHGPPPHGHHGPPPHGRHGPRMPPPPPSLDNNSPPPWMRNETALGYVVNTSQSLEGAYIEYLKKVTGKSVWAVGPLLPLTEADGVDVARAPGNANVEERCLRWLGSRPHGSVLYISFGTEAGPTEDDMAELFAALEAERVPFVVAVQAHQDRLVSAELERRVTWLGLVVRGWVPQLRILRHPSTGGFLSHCGWNSVVESAVCGVPVVAWPIRGDQHANGRLVVREFGTGVLLEEGVTKKRQVIAEAIKSVMLGEKTEQFKSAASELKKKLVDSSTSYEMVLHDFMVSIASKKEEPNEISLLRVL